MASAGRQGQGHSPGHHTSRQRIVQGEGGPVNTTCDQAAPLLGAIPNVPTCPRNDAARAPRPSAPSATETPASEAELLAAWARRRCPHVKPNGRCRLKGGPCRLLSPSPSRCSWADNSALAADEATYRAYLAMTGGPWWRRRNPRPSVPSLVHHAMPRTAQRPCPDCGAALPRRRRLCDACRDGRRREADRLNHRNWRRGPRAQEMP